MYKDLIISQLPDFYKDDPFINDLFNAVGLTLDSLSADMTEVDQQRFFDKLTVLLRDSERLLNLTPVAEIADRRSNVQAKWLSEGKSDIILLQKVANSWKNGEVAVSMIGRYLYIREVSKMTISELQNTKLEKFQGNNSFVGAKILLTFVGENGIPDDLQLLLNAIEQVKPAHLPLETKIKYLLIKDIHNLMTINQLLERKLEEFA